MPLFTDPLLSNVVFGDFQEAWQMLLRTAPRRRPSRLLVFFLSIVVVVDGQETWHLFLKAVPLRKTCHLGQC